MPCHLQTREIAMKQSFWLALLIGAPAVLRGANVDISWGKEPMKMSSTGPENLLPSFFFMAGGEEGGAYVASTGYSGGLGKPSPFLPPDSCPDTRNSGMVTRRRLSRNCMQPTHTHTHTQLI